MGWCLPRWKISEFCPLYESLGQQVDRSGSKNEFVDMLANKCKMLRNSHINAKHKKINAKNGSSEHHTSHSFSRANRPPLPARPHEPTQHNQPPPLRMLNFAKLTGSGAVIAPRRTAAHTARMVRVEDPPLGRRCTPRRSSGRKRGPELFMKAEHNREPQSRRAAEPASRRAGEPQSRRAAEPASRRAGEPQSRRPNPGAPVPPLVPSAKKARFRILLYTGPYYKAFYVPATSTGRSARLFLVIQKENFKKVSLSLCKTRKRKPTAI